MEPRILNLIPNRDNVYHDGNGILLENKNLAGIWQ